MPFNCSLNTAKGFVEARNFGAFHMGQEDNVLNHQLVFLTFVGLIQPVLWKKHSICRSYVTCSAVFCLDNRTLLQFFFFFTFKTGITSVYEKHWHYLINNSGKQFSDIFKTSVTLGVAIGYSTMQMAENPIQTGLTYKKDLLDLVTRKSRILTSGKVYAMVQMM